MSELNRTHDRCDASTTLPTEHGPAEKTSCGAQAYVKVENETGLALLFCRHHYIKNEFALMEQGFLPTVDERHTIENINKLVGSEN